VGSGHFLVSALNEIIAVKSELKILLDRQGRTLRDYQVEVVNDELVITDDDGRFFRYNPRNEENRRVQEALFHEKQTIIENCLFGVDINPKSVMICRLRLWIELLKNAYYTADSGYKELETLPNLDINIKCGNSLISRFPLDADLGEALRKSKWNMDSYRLAVQTYRNAETKEQKRAMEKLITDIKSDFETEVTRNDKRLLKLNKLKGELIKLTTQPSFFEMTKTEKAAWEKQVKKLTTEISSIEAALEEVRSNRIYENAFEWRFEFPEVLDNEGKFVGFDIVIENPPYVFARENFDSSIKKYFVENFKTTQYQVNLFFLFIEKSISILRRNGEFALIVPNSLLMVSSAKSLREYILIETSLTEIINLMGYTFEGVNVETIIFSGKKHQSEENSIKIFMNDGQEFILNQTKVQSLFWNNEGYELNVFSDKESDAIINKLKSNTETLNNLVKIKAGLKAYESGKGVPKQSPEDVINRIYDYTNKQDSDTFEYLEGKDVSRYFLKWSGSYLRYGDHLAAPRTFDIFNNRKIIIREITGKFPHYIDATYSEDVYLFNMSNIAVLDKENSNISLKYILGLLNSKLMSYYFIKNTAKSVRQMFPKLIIEDLRKFPIKSISISDQQTLINLVNQILAAKKSDPRADTTALENEIDQLVYDLYGLTEEERQIVEGG
jgi:tRNA1(Val) A37 N6-methylase TrmN6